MTLENVLAGFRNETIDPERRKARSALVETLVQDSIRICMEINNRYHTPHEITELM